MTSFSIIQDELASIVSKAKETALQDGAISHDEAALLDLLQDQLSFIEEDLKKITSLLPKDLSEQEVRNRVKLLSQDIIPKLVDQAKTDGKITADEKILLNRIMDQVVN